MKLLTRPAFLASLASLARILIHALRLRSAANGQMNDRAFFSAGPALCSIRKRKTEQRDLRDLTLLYPGESTIGSPVDHAPFPRNPSGLRIGKAYSKEVGQLRTGAGAG